MNSLFILNYYIAPLSGSQGQDRAWQGNHRGVDLLQLYCSCRQQCLPVRHRSLQAFFYLGYSNKQPSRYLKLRAYIIILQRRSAEFSIDASLTDAYTFKHQRRLEDTRKAIKTTYAHLLAGSLEDLYVIIYHGLDGTL